MKNYYIFLSLLYSIPVAAAVVKIVDYPHFENVVLKSTKPVVVIFSWEQCGACMAIKEPLQNVASSPTYNETVIFAEVDIAQLQDIANQYSVLAVPSFIYMSNGVVMDRSEGADTKTFESDFTKKIDTTFFQDKQSGIWNTVNRSLQRSIEYIKTAWNKTVYTIKGWFGR